MTSFGLSWIRTTSRSKASLTVCCFDELCQGSGACQQIPRPKEGLLQWSECWSFIWCAVMKDGKATWAFPKESLDPLSTFPIHSGRWQNLSTWEGHHVPSELGVLKPQGLGVRNVVQNPGSRASVQNLLLSLTPPSLTLTPNGNRKLSEPAGRPPWLS